MTTSMHYIRCLLCGGDILGNEYGVHQRACNQEFMRPIGPNAAEAQADFAGVIPHEVPSGE